MQKKWLKLVSATVGIFGPICYERYLWNQQTKNYQLQQKAQYKISMTWSRSNVFSCISPGAAPPDQRLLHRTSPPDMQNTNDAKICQDKSTQQSSVKYDV